MLTYSWPTDMHNVGFRVLLGFFFFFAIAFLMGLFVYLFGLF